MEMIRKQRESDLDDVTRIWLTSNLGAHDFIPEEYWKGNLDAVRSAIGGAEVYVHEDDRGRLDGFIGLDGEFIEGLFVAEGARSHGVGKMLLDHAKSRKRRLELSVYRKNTRAAAFYNREGFTVTSEGIDADTGERELTMFWSDDTTE